MRQYIYFNPKIHNYYIMYLRTLTGSPWVHWTFSALIKSDHFPRFPPDFLNDWYLCGQEN